MPIVGEVNNDATKEVVEGTETGKNDKVTKII